MTPKSRRRREAPRMYNNIATTAPNRRLPRRSRCIQHVGRDRAAGAAVQIHVYPKRGPRTTDEVRFLRTARAVVVARHFHSGRVCCRCDGCAPFTGPVVSGRRVNWFTEKTISALAYRILSTPRFTRNVAGASACRHTEQLFEFVVVNRPA